MINTLRILNPVLGLHPVLHLMGTELVSFGANKNQWLTLGDLHGNALKLLYFMVSQGVAGITPADYQTFVTLYNQDLTVDTQENLALFKSLLNKITISPDSYVRLIGDELADRGKNDLFTLLLMHHFKKNGGHLEIIFSNHSSAFILLIESAINQATINGKLDPEIFKAIFCKNTLEHMTEEIHGSFFACVTCISQGLITPAELISLYDSYKSSIKAYSYDHDDKGKLIIYSHAPISKTTDIIPICDELTNCLTDAEDMTLTETKLRPCKDEDMPPLIDAINRVVAKKIQVNQFSSILFLSKYAKSKLLWSCERRDDPGDNEINNLHGHLHYTFGARTTLDTFCGRAVSNLYDLSMPFTKTSIFPKLIVEAKPTTSMLRPSVPTAVPQPQLMVRPSSQIRYVIPHYVFK